MGFTRLLSSRVAAVLMSLAIASSVAARPKEKTYPTSCDRVWGAVKKATAPPHYNFAQLDDTQKKGIVSTGNTITGKRLVDIALSGSGNSCTVAIGGVFSGLVHNDKGDLFERIQANLLEFPESSPQVDHQAETKVPAKSDLKASVLTNSDVVKLKDAGLGESVIIEKIKASRASYLLDTTDLIELKHAGLSDAVIGAMIQASQD